ncbi:matrixin family metalloprotease [Archangium minus]|uniref:Matrixin family metalloprotease n=1 Tax=Archangium minus TaxID=83450 RepID=A0ABY9WIB7_9BACT|nr:matrixin family metalloprotease [Archangium minus]
MRKVSMALLAGVALVGCGGPELAEQQQIPTFEEFQAQAIKDEGDVYVVNGDEAIEGIEGLKAYYDNYVANGDVGTTEGGLAVYYSGGRDIKWSTTQARNLTYCVSRTSFGTRYNTAVTAMANAAAAWEATANVNFVHSSSYDSSCTASQSAVVFDVRMVSGAGYTARAFFPNSSRSARNVLIDSSAFGNMGAWTLTGVLRHELGHALGFRHEHTRLQSTGCYEDSAWRGLTTYDSSSVMHYPQCNGTQTGDLVLTSKDKTGARALYP